MKIDKRIIEKLVNEFYISREILDMSIQNECNMLLLEKDDVSDAILEENDNEAFELSLHLQQLKSDSTIQDESLRERLHMLGVLLYMSFKEEREGFANGLNGFLRNCGYKITRDNVDNLARHDESHVILHVLKVLNDVFNGLINDPKTDEAIEYINNMHYTSKQYSREYLKKLSDKTLRDFEKRIGRAKYNLIDVNENKLLKINEMKYIPLNIRKEKRNV